jgi:hypothetical protein
MTRLNANVPEQTLEEQGLKVLISRIRTMLILSIRQLVPSTVHPSPSNHTLLPSLQKRSLTHTLPPHSTVTVTGRRTCPITSRRLPVTPDRTTNAGQQSAACVAATLVPLRAALRIEDRCRTSMQR